MAHLDNINWFQLCIFALLIIIRIEEKNNLKRFAYRFGILLVTEKILI